MTFESSRVSRAATGSSRRVTGGTTASWRTGSTLEAQRSGRGLIDDLNSVVSPVQSGKTLGTLDPRGARPAARGIANYKPPAAGQGAGIASPLQEQDYATRTFFDPQLIESSDGLFTLRIEPLERLVMRDANNAEAVFLFKEPPAPDL